MPVCHDNQEFGFIQKILNKCRVWRKSHLSLEATGLLNFTDRILAISDYLKDLDNVSE
jgi:hypothetical protein